mmetsp:Transcript_24725/g.43564  ORF Transcript_24725/g.43564 Transcript_24725/m.43564 type:complete len:475 (-) Transcript_24725:34-1458(-)
MESSCAHCDVQYSHVCLCVDAKLCLQCITRHIAESPSSFHSVVVSDVCEKSQFEIRELMNSYESEQQEALQNKESLLHFLDELQERLKAKADEMIKRLSSSEIEAKLALIIDHIKAKKAASIECKYKTLTLKLDEIKDRVRHMEIDKLLPQDFPWNYLAASIKTFDRHAKMQCVESQSNINMTKFERVLDESMEFKLDLNLSSLIELQNYAYYPVPGQNKIQVHDFNTNKGDYYELPLALPFSSFCTSFILPDKSVAIVGTTSSDSVVQRVSPLDWKVTPYQPMPEKANNACIAACGCFIYAIALSTNAVYALDLNFRRWTRLTNLIKGVSPLACAANERDLCVLGRFENALAVSVYNFESGGHSLLRFVTKLDHDMRILPVEHFFLFIGKTTAFTLHEGVLESIPYETKVIQYKKESSSTLQEEAGFMQRSLATVNFIRGSINCYSEDQKTPVNKRVTIYKRADIPIKSAYIL